MMPKILIKNEFADNNEISVQHEESSDIMADVDWDNTESDI